ncbi:hypothetical protein Ancab_024566 [Ancistrocladus abbreviatus]
MLWVKVDEDAFPIKVAKESSKFEDWFGENRIDNDGSCDTFSSPSISISAVPDSFGNNIASEQQPMVVVDNSKFKFEKKDVTTTIPRESSVNDEMVLGKSRKDDLSRDAKCRINDIEIYSKSSGERVNKTQGWGASSEGDSILFLSGPERLKYVDSLSKAQVRVLNRAKFFAGPENRPQHLETIEDIQRASALAYNTVDHSTASGSMGAWLADIQLAKTGSLAIALLLILNFENDYNCL